jgi:hypothetical protein
MKFYFACALLLVTIASFAASAKSNINNSLVVGRIAISYKNNDTANINRLVKLAGNVFRSDPDLDQTPTARYISQKKVSRFRRKLTINPEQPTVCFSSGMLIILREILIRQG